MASNISVIATFSQVIEFLFSGRIDILLLLLFSGFFPSVVWMHAKVLRKDSTRLHGSGHILKQLKFARCR